jgi:hypothetical protein
MTPARSDSNRCPVCRDPLAEPIQSCPTCETPLHLECAQYIGGCARFACAEAATARKRLGELLRLGRRVDWYGWIGFTLFALAFLAESILAGGRMALDALAAVTLLVSLWQVRASRPAREESGSPELATSTLRAALSSLADSSPRVSRATAWLTLLVGLSYASVRLIFWRGPWPFTLGLLFLAGCVLSSRFTLVAASHQTQFARLAAAWRDELESLLERGEIDDKSRIKLLEGTWDAAPDSLPAD